MTMMSEDERETFSQYLTALINISLSEGGTMSLTINEPSSKEARYTFSVKKASGETILNTAVGSLAYSEFVRHICNIISAEKELVQ